MQITANELFIKQKTYFPATKAFYYQINDKKNIGHVTFRSAVRHTNENSKIARSTPTYSQHCHQSSAFFLNRQASFAAAAKGYFAIFGKIL